MRRTVVDNYPHYCRHNQRVIEQCVDAALSDASIRQRIEHSCMEKAYAAHGLDYAECASKAKQVEQSAVTDETEANVVIEENVDMEISTPSPSE